MRTAVMILFVLGCGARAPPAKPTQTCLTDPPPTLPRGVHQGLVTEGCPPSAVCLSPAAAVALAEWIGETRQWVLAAWIKCGLAPTVAGGFGSAGATRGSRWDRVPSVRAPTPHWTRSPPELE